MDFGTSSSDFPGNRNRTEGSSGRYNHASSTHETVSVTVPLNKYGGDQIIVSSASGKCVNAVIPHAMKSGDVFRVDIPLNDGLGNNNFGTWTQSTSINHAPQQAVTPIQYPSPSAPPMECGVHNNENKFAENRNDTANMFDSLRHSTNTNIIAESPKNLILVKVPPGAAPGTMIQIKVPGEDRMISATVPPNASEFHVSYDPRPQQRRVQNWEPNSLSTSGTNTTGNASAFRAYDGDGLAYSSNGSKQKFVHNRKGNQKVNQYQPKRNEDDSLGVLAPMLVGSALLGAAGIMIGKHHNG